MQVPISLSLSLSPSRKYTSLLFAPTVVGLLRTLVGYLRTFALFVCVRFVCRLEHLKFRDQQTTILVLQRTKVQYTFAISGTVVEPCLNGGASDPDPGHVCHNS